MAEQLPVTPAILTWARERAGLSLDQATEKFRRFAEWELGSSYPTYSQLEQMSDMFKVPIAVFFFPSPPEVPPIAETFRTLPKVELDNLPGRIKMLLRKAKSFQLNLAELTNGRNPSNRLITRDLTFAPTVDISLMAEQVRQYLGVTVADQMQWQDSEMALKEWRSALHDVGVYVFKDAFKLEDFSGLCLYDDQFPLIYVNNSSTKTRQIFTYFHELAHLIFHTSGIDKVNDDYIEHLSVDDSTVEILCNRFAAQFLLPANAFEQAMKGLYASEDSAEQIAAQFHVSREVVFRRFLDQKRITESVYKAAVQRWNGQRQAADGAGGNHYWTKLAYLGRDYVSLALSQFHQQRIDENQLADYLDTKPKNVGTLEEYFERGSA